MDMAEWVKDLNAVLAAHGSGAVEAVGLEEHKRVRLLHVNVKGSPALVQRELSKAFEHDAVVQAVARFAGKAEIIVTMNEVPYLLLRDGKQLIVSSPPARRAENPEATAFEDWFQRLIEAPCPVRYDLVQVDDGLWGSENTRNLQVTGLPYTLGIPQLRSYVLVGHTGYGMNSYALYVTRVSGNVRMHLRLPWGGVYLDPEKARPRLVAALADATQLCDLAVERKLPLTLINNMGTWSFAPAPAVIRGGGTSIRNLQPVWDYVNSRGSTD